MISFKKAAVIFLFLLRIVVGNAAEVNSIDPSKDRLLFLPIFSLLGIRISRARSDVFESSPSTIGRLSNAFATLAKMVSHVMMLTGS